MHNNALQVFNYNDSQIRVVEKDGTAWFVAKDVCDVLGLKNVNRAIYKLDDDEKLTLKLLTSGQNRDVATVSESGLYALVLRSYKAEAKQFRRWVTHEVLPDIRKYGMYMTNNVQEAATTNPEAFNALLKAYTQEKEKVKTLEAKIQDDAPYATIGRVVLSLPGSVTIADAAQFMAQHGINIGRNRLMKLLREKGLLSKQKKRWNKPTQLGIEKGIVNLELDREQGYQFTPRSMVTSKGLQNITVNLFVREYPLEVLFAQSEDKEEQQCAG